MLVTTTEVTQPISVPSKLVIKSDVQAQHILPLSTSPGLFRDADMPAPEPPKQPTTNSDISPPCFLEATAADIEANLKRFINTELIFPDYLDTVQKGTITENARSELFRWLHALGEYFKFSAQTFSLTTTIFDQFLSRVRVQPKYIQVVGVSSFLLASKLAEDDEVQPTLYELSANSGFAFTVSDIKRMELVILTKLNWELKTVTPLVVLEELYAFVLLSPSQPDCVRLPSFLTNCVAKLTACTLSYELLSFRGSTLALCVLALALEAQTDAAYSGPIVAAMSALTGVYEVELASCKKSLSSYFGPRLPSQTRDRI